ETSMQVHVSHLRDSDAIESIGEARNLDVVAGDVDSTALDTECIGCEGSSGRRGTQEESTAGDVKRAHYAQV
ncbi:MAG TPA: hypothetical protein VLB12_00180, partial [Gemmatimonadales bacterium]|nr:hypothetical protein [Gemmatimonadales bacterium]